MICSMCGVGVYLVYSNLSKNLSNRLNLRDLIDQPTIKVESDRSYYTTITDKYKIEFPKAEDLKATSIDQVKYSGSVEVSETITNPQLNGVVDSWIEMFTYTPVKDIDIQLNSDGTTEVSAIVDVDKAIKYAEQYGVSEAELNSYKESFGSLLPTTVSVYAKGTASIIDNTVQIDINSLRVMGIPIDLTNVNEVNSGVSNFISNRLKAVPNLSIKTLQNNNGKLEFKGTVPSATKIEPEVKAEDNQK